MSRFRIVIIISTLIITTVTMSIITVITTITSTIRKLGTGGFAMVYLVEHIETGKFYAAKYLRSTKENDESVEKSEEAIISLKQNAKTEVALLKRLSDCNHTVGFRDYFEGLNECVIVTEYLAGCDLFRALSQSTFHLTENKCKIFASQILQALDYMHTSRMVHLDIKPNNIMFTSPDEQNLQIKLIDFGLARELGGTGKVKCNMVGTLEFMAPEVMKCTFASPASDIWSFGVLLYMILSGGVSPFWAGNDYSTQRKVMKGLFSLDISQFQDISEDAKDLLTLVLRVPSEKRISSKKALKHPWLKLDDELATELKDAKVNTEMMKRYTARRHWQLLKYTVKLLQVWSRTDKSNNNEDCPIDKIIKTHLRKSKLKNTFRKKKKTRSASLY